MRDDAPSPPWYAVHVRSNFERKASGLASRKLGTPIFYPSYRVRSLRRAREHTIEKPLFPGYFFIQTDLASGTRTPLLQVSGVVDIVSAGGRPVPVDSGVMESLRILGEHPERVRPHPFLREGMRVRMTAGPFAGARGIIVEEAGRRPHLVVGIEILGRSVGVPVDPGDLEPT